METLTHRFSCLRSDRNHLVTALAVLFGMGAWVSINGVWVEMYRLTNVLPEGWDLASYLSVIIQIANIGPLLCSFLLTKWPHLTPVPFIYFILFIGCLSSVLLILFWEKTLDLFGEVRSVPLMILLFFLSLVDCTSSVLFAPYMSCWKMVYLPWYYVGESLSGLAPALVSMGPEIPVSEFFVALACMMFICAGAFTLLNNVPAFRKERSHERREKGITSSPDPPLIEDEKNTRHWNTKILYMLWLFQVLGGFLSNGLLPGLQPYSIKPFGDKAYRLVSQITPFASPVASLFTTFAPRATPRVISSIMMVNLIIAAILIAGIAMSPFPPLVGSATGVVIIVCLWVVFALLKSYLHVEGNNMLRQLPSQQAERALVFSGASTQAGSFVGAVLSFLLVNVAKVFKKGA